ncbi:MAG TPA: sigma-70 family RNA polymerase sigma factor [Solirubrobacterales bacterium]|nr:sigma-70 family RNA polymerase sigma factor [Solirubrobacterales bacterium]
MAGRLDDLTRLYDRTARTLIVFFQRRVEDPEAAVDLTSETFTIAAERYSQFRGETDRELSGWLWSIARTVLSEHERHREVVSRRGGILADERRALTDAEIERIEELAETAELRDEVERRLELLPEDQREAVRLRVVEDLPYEEVAARLRITSSGARSRVERGLRRLRRQLDLDLGEERDR